MADANSASPAGSAAREPDGPPRGRTRAGEARASSNPPQAWGGRHPTHETADIDGRHVWETAAVFAGTIVLAGLLAAGAIALLGTMVGRPLTPINPPPTRMPSPPLQSAPPLDLRALRAEKHALLSGYAWVDRAHGIVRIPIERAMSLLIARGSMQKP